MCPFFIINYLFFRICNEFENFKSRALTVPDDSTEITELTQFIEHSRTKLIPELTQDISVSRSHMSYVLSVHSCDQSIFELNSVTIDWPQRLEPIFDKNEDILLQAGMRAEKALVEKRDKLKIEIEKATRFVCVCVTMDTIVFIVYML